MMDKGKYLYLNSRDEFYRIEVSKIVYFEADGNYTHIMLTNHMRGTVCMNLSKMQEILNSTLSDRASRFARVGKSHIINLNYVYHIAILRQKLELSDGVNFNYSLSVSKEALKGLKGMYTGNGTDK
jgi:hypothetical protein